MYAKSENRHSEILFAGWDTETRGLGGKLLAITAFIDGQSYYWKGSESRMIRSFLRVLADYPQPYVHYAHHAQYDWRYILPYVAAHNIPCEIMMRTETDIYEIQLTIRGRRIIMRDSMALWIGKLEELAAKYAPEFPKLEIDIENFDPDNPEHEAYARRDAQILAVALPRLDAMCHKHFGVGVGVTAASTAIKAWQETLGDDEIYECSKDGETERFIREAYYGGLVFLTRNDLLSSRDNLPVARTYDRNSSYPAAMCEHGVPYGRVGISGDYKEGKMGIYRVRVRAPENLIVPILPTRNAHGHMIWRSGEFDTVVTNRELIFACNHGYEIIDIYEGIYFEQTVFPFNTFVDHCKYLRFTFPDTPLSDWAKRLQNSVYGKPGARRERNRIYVPQSEEEMLEGIPLDQCDYFWVKKEFAEKMKCLPQWSVFITAHARLALLQTIYTCGAENVLYGDTDSVTVLTGHDSEIDVGKEYGQWKLEKEWRTFRAIAPKVYVGQLMNGDWKGAAKGVPKKGLSQKHWEELLRTGQTSAQALSLGSLRVALAKGFEPAEILTRKSSSLNNSANWRLQGNDVRPKIA